MKNNWPGRMIPGLILITIGTLFLLERFGVPVPDIGTLIGTYWPVILIVIGLKALIGCNRRSNWVWGIALTMLGVVFLSNRVGWSADIDFGDIVKMAVPIVLIALGIRMLFGRRGNGGSDPVPPPFAGDGRGLDYGSRSEPDAPVWPDPSAKAAGTPIAGIPSELDERFPLEDEPADPAARPAAAEPNPERPTGETSPGGGGHAGTTDHSAPGGPPPYWTPPWKAFGDPHAAREARREWKQQRKEWKQRWREELHARHTPTWAQWGNHYGHRNGVEHRSSFIGDIRIGQSYWELKPLSISHFIGDTELDLTKAHIPDGETRVQVSAFIGDVKVYIPDDPEIEVVVRADSFIGDVMLPEAGPRQGRDCEKKVVFHISLFIGDVKVKRLS